MNVKPRFKKTVTFKKLQLKALANADKSDEIVALLSNLHDVKESEIVNGSQTKSKNVAWSIFLLG